ncbi:unnamed protein product [Brugia timori]|uniref:Ovule protein n=1 Tax=Brugia timori TaxID=42155 RepID=A0A0R3R0N2_9BILA|nr:unnamed protein product [Brugia timori]
MVKIGDFEYFVSTKLIEIGYLSFDVCCISKRRLMSSITGSKKCDSGPRSSILLSEFDTEYACSDHAVDGTSRGADCSTELLLGIMHDSSPYDAVYRLH